MSSTQLIVTIVVVVVVVVVAALVWSVLRRRRLQRRFGPEYERLVEEQPNRSAAEHELRAREQRHAELDLRPLDAQDRRRYLQEWSAVQAAFVENPGRAVDDADSLVTRVLADRGYPTGSFEDRLDTLSVEHAQTLDRYRQAHEITLAHRRGEASTEQLRRAVVHYRALAGDLLDAQNGARHRSPAQTDERGSR